MGMDIKPTVPATRVAILVKLVESLVPRLDEIHSHTINHVSERLNIDRKSREGIAQRRVDHIHRLPVKDTLEAFFPSIERFRGDVRRIRSVD